MDAYDEEVKESDEMAIRFPKWNSAGLSAVSLTPEAMN